MEVQLENVIEGNINVHRRSNAVSVIAPTGDFDYWCIKTPAPDDTEHQTQAEFFNNVVYVRMLGEEEDTNDTRDQVPYLSREHRDGPDPGEMSRLQGIHPGQIGPKPGTWPDDSDSRRTKPASIRERS